MENSFQDLNSLKESRDFLNILINNINSAILISDDQFRIEGFNDTLKKMLQKDNADIKNKLCGNLLGCSFAVEENKPCGETSNCHSCMLRLKIKISLSLQLSTIRNVLKRDFYINGNKEEKYIEFTIKPLTYNDKIYSLVILDDITTLEKQKEKLRTQNAEITDSISYAKMLQDAMIPTDEILKEFFSDYFIFYQPKDIIGGDFYWIKKAANRIIIAVADCTGHGVPGAFLSVLGITQLDEIILKNQNIRVDEILSQLRTNIIKTLHQKGDDAVLDDGMDIAIISYNIDSSEIEYSGAYNSIFHIHNHQLEEIEADQMPIGIYNCDRPFSLKKFRVSKGDIIYLFSDGYADQFGGTEGKKFKYSSFRNLFLEHHKKSLKKQKSIIKDIFNNWKGTNDQVDDILIVGIRF